MRQILKSVCVCQSVCLSVCEHSHGRISWSIFTKIGTDVRTPPPKTSSLGVNIAPPPLPLWILFHNPTQRRQSHNVIKDQNDGHDVGLPHVAIHRDTVSGSVLVLKLFLSCLNENCKIFSYHSLLRKVHSRNIFFWFYMCYFHALHVFNGFLSVGAFLPCNPVKLVYCLVPLSCLFMFRKWMID